jgi:hypothetical protein
MAHFNKKFTQTPSYKGSLKGDVLSEKFKRVFPFTASWEGPWDGGDKPLKVAGRFNDAVAAYGITPLFLKEFIGQPDKDITLAYMKSINYNRAAKIWQGSRWLYYKCEEIASDEIALLVFDWAVRRPEVVAEEMAKAVGLTKDSGTESRKYREFGGNPYGANDGQYYPNYATIDAINAACKENGVFNEVKIKALYDRIITTRIEKEKGLPEGAKRRLGCLLFGEWLITVNTFNDLPAARKKQILDGVTAIRNKRNLMVQKQAQLDADTEGSYAKYIAGAFALWLGYKWFKNRKKR